MSSINPGPSNNIGAMLDQQTYSSPPPARVKPAQRICEAVLSDSVSRDELKLMALKILHDLAQESGNKPEMKRLSDEILKQTTG